ncbi:hypothetical protein IXX22_11640, partial [Escherichia coli]
PTGDVIHPGQPVSGGPNDTSVGEISVKTGNNARNGGKNSLNRLIRCVCGKKIGPDPRNFNQRVSLGRNDLLIRTFLNLKTGKAQMIEYGDNQLCSGSNKPFFEIKNGVPTVGVIDTSGKPVVVAQDKLKI